MHSKHIGVWKVGRCGLLAAAVDVVELRVWWEVNEVAGVKFALRVFVRLCV